MFSGTSLNIDSLVGCGSVLKMSINRLPRHSVDQLIKLLVSNSNIFLTLGISQVKIEVRIAHKVNK